MRTYEWPALVNGNMTGNLTSSNIQLLNMFGASVSCVVTGDSSASGVLAIQGSSDGINFTQLENEAVPVTLNVSGNGTYIFDVVETQLQYLNVIYTVSGGTGTLNITVYSKGF
jgi:hypothetical protein